MDAIEILDLMKQGAAPGLFDSWDFQPNPGAPDLYEEWLAVAQALKWAVKDRIDQLRIERNPATAVEKLPDYELALGLQYTYAAQWGSVSQRQGQIVGRFRETGGLTIASLQTVMQAYLRYNDPTQILIVEPDRAALKAAHTYPFTSPVTLTGVTVVISLSTPGNVVSDDSYVSDGGAQLAINITVVGGGEPGIFQLRGPDGFVHEWDLIDYRPLGVVVGANTVYDLQLRAQDFAPQLNATQTGYDRRKINGTWTLTVKNLAGTVNAASLFVEGVGRNSAGADGLGAALFEWGVLAETAKLGAGADLIGAAAAVRRMDHCHLNGHLLLDGLLVSSPAMIPDDPNAIPDMGIPG